MQQNDYEQRKEFFQTLFDKTEGYIEIRSIDKQGKVKQDWYETSEIDRMLFEIRKPYFLKVNTYFGVCPRRGKKGTEKDVSRVNCLWVDLDAKDREGKRVIKTKLDDFDPEPSMIINSGNGYHSYWLFDKLEEINTQEDINRIKGYNKGLAEELKADKQVIDLSRILRVPGTKNLKDPEETLAVTIEKFAPHIRYSLKGQFLARFKRDIEKSNITEEVNIEDIVEIPERFYQVLSDNERLENTWKGKRPDLRDQTRSGYDMSLVSQLVELDFSTEEIAAILKGFKYGKGSDARKGYFEWTIGKAKGGQKKRRKEKEKRLDEDKERFLSLEKKIPTKEKKAPPTKKSEGNLKQISDRIFITGRQLVKEKVKELPAPVKKGLFVSQRYTILAASDGEGKTLFCTQLALSAITGTTFLGFFPILKPAKVLYFCGENSRGDMQTKIKRQQEEIEKLLGRSIEKELEENFILVEPLNINFFLNPKDKIELHAWLEDHKPDIVIFDPLADFISSQKSLSDDTLARITGKTLTEIAQKYKCFPLLTTHLRKEAINPQTGRSIVTPENVWDFIFGSRFWIASAAAQIVIIRANLQRYPKAKKFCFKFKTADPIDPLQVLRNPNLFYEELPKDRMSLASLTTQDVVEILERKCKGQQVETILTDTVAKELGCSKTIARDLVRTGIRTNLLYKDKKDNLIKVTPRVEKGLNI